MSIMDNLRSYGSSIVSGIGNAFSTAILPSKQDASITSTLLSGASGLVNSVVSGISSAIAPRHSTTRQTTPSPTPNREFVFIGNDGKVLGLSQTTWLLIIAGLAGSYVIFGRGRR